MIFSLKLISEKKIFLEFFLTFDSIVLITFFRRILTALCRISNQVVITTPGMYSMPAECQRLNFIETYTNMSWKYIINLLKNFHEVFVQVCISFIYNQWDTSTKIKGLTRTTADSDRRNYKNPKAEQPRGCYSNRTRGSSGLRRDEKGTNSTNHAARAKLFNSNLITTKDILWRCGVFSAVPSKITLCC